MALLSYKVLFIGVGLFLFAVTVETIFFVNISLAFQMKNVLTNAPNPYSSGPEGELRW
jgi:hypothetical protein